tara:strand:+ start:7087 stop:7521 length:435 start_codon:yes stop_codon:yes gene_type:complete
MHKNKWIGPLLFAIGVFLIFFLSWKANPNLNETVFIPDWLSDWTDQSRNSRRRTAVPFVGLSILVAVYLISIKKTKLVFWLLAWFCLGIIVTIAEAGQYFLPARRVDIKDIIWGGIGAGIGLCLSFVVWQFFRLFKTKHIGGKK